MDRKNLLSKMVPEQDIKLPEFSLGPVESHNDSMHNNLNLANQPEKPDNKSGVWSVFEGNMRFEYGSKTIVLPEVNLATFENWNRIT